MPKIIENLERRIPEEAKRQIEESRYSALTIRSVASSCGMQVCRFFPSISQSSPAPAG